MNPREQLVHIATWLGLQDENLSRGLKNAFDALRLYDYGMTHPELSEMADEWARKHRIAAVGYDPLAYADAREPGRLTGAIAVVHAMKTTRALLSSVAFVSVNGDTRNPIALIDKVLSI